MPPPQLFRCNLFSNTNRIYGQELLALLALIVLRTGTFRGRSINIYVENNCAVGALIRSDSGAPVVDKMVALFWEICASHCIAMWVGRAPSTINIAYSPEQNEPPSQLGGALLLLTFASSFDEPSAPLMRPLLSKLKSSENGESLTEG